MTKFVIVSLVALVSFCEAGLIPSELVYPNFPNLKTVHHGHGATSYQNVNLQNYGSVPIPKDLQVDEGNEYQNHHQYLYHIDQTNDHELPPFDLQNYVDGNVNVEHVIVSTEAPYELNEHSDPMELESQHNYASPSHYDHYDHEVEYDYH